MLKQLISYTDSYIVLTPFYNIIKFCQKDFKKQSPSDQAVSQFHSKFFRPSDRLLAG